MTGKNLVFYGGRCPQTKYLNLSVFQGGGKKKQLISGDFNDERGKKEIKKGVGRGEKTHMN